MRAPRRAKRRRSDNRWRETCVDGLLHVAFAAAAGAESAAHRCAHTLARRRSLPPRRGSAPRRLRRR
ncbi:MAG TPA: hypothetical protein VFF79_02505 [Conexibacter sp.]|nr:hypothetical protein [Conexibacter sp.]